MTEQPKELTEEQIKDCQDRGKAFNAELLSLMEKHQMSIVPISFITPAGTIAAKCLNADTKYAPKEDKKKEAIAEG